MTFLFYSLVSVGWKARGVTGAEGRLLLLLELCPQEAQLPHTFAWLLAVDASVCISGFISGAYIEWGKWM